MGTGSTRRVGDDDTLEVETHLRRTGIPDPWLGRDVWFSPRIKPVDREQGRCSVAVNDEMSLDACNDKSFEADEPLGH